MNIENTFVKLYEAINVKKVGPTTVLNRDIETKKLKRTDLVNFIFANTTAGNDKFTVYTIRKNDSKTDSSKKAGDEMIINGTLRIPKACIKGTGSHLGDAKNLYSKYKLLRMLVMSVDGRKYKPCSIRSFDVSGIYKLVMNRNTYNIV